MLHSPEPKSRARAALATLLAAVLAGSLPATPATAPGGDRGVSPAPAGEDRTRLLEYLDENGRLLPVRSRTDWQKRRQHVLARMQEVMGAFPRPPVPAPPDVRIQEEVRAGDFTRKRLTYAADRNNRVPAYLFIPAAAKGRARAVLCLHQTVPIGKAQPAGLDRVTNMHYALELARRGYVALAPDYPSFGDYGFDFARGRFPSGSMQAIWNNVRAVDLLESLPEVDGDRIGCLGHSLGGHNAIFTAAFDTRIKAVVSSCGFTRFPRYQGGNLKGWTSPRYMPRIETLYDARPARVPFDFPEVVAALAPRPFLAVAPLHDDNFDVTGVRETEAAARPVYALFDASERLAARYPDAGHDFLPADRKAAYEWLDRWLK